MKPTQLFMTVSCLLLCAVIGQAQQTGLPQEDAEQEALAEQFLKTFLTIGYRQLWGGQDMNETVFKALDDPAIRAAWDISDEQNQQREDLMIDILSSSEEAAELGIGVRKIEGKMVFSIASSITSSWDDDEYFLKLQEYGAQALLVEMDAHVKALDKTLTPEQKQKLGESLLANMPEILLPFPAMFEALDLTDAQRQQMEQIQQEFEPEFEKTIEIWVNGATTLLMKEAMTLEIGESDELGEEEEPTTRESETDKQEKFLAEHPELRGILEEMLSSVDTFSTKFKTRMFDVLTDEQWTRLQDLIDNPPEHALVFRKVLKEQSGEAEESEEREKSEKAEVWQPGPNSWKPGDAIPEEYRIERNQRSRFPRGEREE